MSVYKPPRTAIYLYDFQVRRHRFHGSTGATTEREARAVERERRREALKEIEAAERALSAPMTIDIAAQRYWEQVAQHQKRPDQREWELDWLVRALGPNTLLTEIGNPQVAEMVAKRRGEGVSNATVNRSVLEPLRRVIYRARDVWEMQVRAIEWKKHRLKEPKERVRELSEDEEARMWAALPARYVPVVRFALLTGCRLAECVGLVWDQVDWGNRELVIHGKGDRIDRIPMSSDVRDLLWGLDRDGETVFGVTVPGLDTAFGRAMKAARIPGFRFHDLRHTFATRTKRRTGDLQIVSKLLRHTEIGTTARYAHVTREDLRAAVETRNPEIVPNSPKKVKGIKAR